MAKVIQRTHWCVTHFATETELEADGGDEGYYVRRFSEWSGGTSGRIAVRYACWQRECCPDTGRLHTQLYVEFTRSVVLGSVRKLLPGAHFEPRRGTRDEARAYCRKEDSRLCGPWEFGDYALGGSGARSDLLQLSDAIVEGKELRQVAEELPSTWIRYHRGASDLASRIHPPVRRDIPDVRVYIGEPGTGKSLKAYELYPEAFRFWSESNWWDGYDGESVVIFDDYEGCVPYRFLMQVLDQFPLRIPIKGSSVALCATTFIFTTNQQLWNWYSGDTSALRRRITEVLKFTVTDGVYSTETLTSNDI